MCTGSLTASIFCEKLAARDDKCPVGAGEVDQFIIFPVLCEHTKNICYMTWFTEIIIQIQINVAKMMAKANKQGCYLLSYYNNTQIHDNEHWVRSRACIRDFSSLSFRHSDNS
jgi:hypothetical protein